MSRLISLLPLLVALAPCCSSFAPLNQPPSILVSRGELVREVSVRRPVVVASSRRNDGDLFVDRTTSIEETIITPPSDLDVILERVGKAATSTLLALALSFVAVTSPFVGTSSVPSAHATDGARGTELKAPWR